MCVIGHPDRDRLEEQRDPQVAAISGVLAAHAREAMALDAAPNCLQRAKEVLVTTVAVLATANRSEPAAKASGIQSLEQEIGDTIRHRSESEKCRLSHRPAGRSTPQEASANCGNAPIGESVEKWASDGGSCPLSPTAPIAPMSRPWESIICRLAGVALVRDRRSRRRRPAEIAKIAEIGESVEKSASDGGPHLLPQIALIAEISLGAAR
jgi:hypothetical protein